MRRFCAPWKAISAYAAPLASSPTIATAPIRARPRAAPRLARLREELAAANEERDLDRQLSALTTQARALRERGAMKAADPQAELLSVSRPASSRLRT